MTQPIRTYYGRFISHQVDIAAKITDWMPTETVQLIDTWQTQLYNY